MGDNNQGSSFFSFQQVKRFYGVYFFFLWSGMKKVCDFRCGFVYIIDFLKGEQRGCWCGVIGQRQLVIYIICKYLIFFLLFLYWVFEFLKMNYFFFLYGSYFIIWLEERSDMVLQMFRFFNFLFSFSVIVFQRFLVQQRREMEIDCYRCNRCIYKGFQQCERGRNWIFLYFWLQFRGKNFSFLMKVYFIEYFDVENLFIFFVIFQDREINLREYQGGWVFCLELYSY